MNIFYLEVGELIADVEYNGINRTTKLGFGTRLDILNNILDIWKYNTGRIIFAN